MLRYLVVKMMFVDFCAFHQMIQTNLSGLNSSGSSQISGSLVMPYIGISMCIPFGIFIPPIVISSLQSLEFLVKIHCKLIIVESNSNNKIQNAEQPSTTHRARLQLTFYQTDFT